MKNNTAIISNKEMQDCNTQEERISILKSKGAPTLGNDLDPVYDFLFDVVDDVGLKIEWIRVDE